ncbi:LPXTG cell wall anchor domain-containing protein [Streptomyces avermitilis]|uniref:LPXTG cell wall anchor domain-containing protein n=1 Tax=Streptomyces avermitilis TaxID=33903 RepID=UPI0033A47103
MSTLVTPPRCVTPARSLPTAAGPLSTALVCGGAALLPWMVVLARTLPATAEVRNWSSAWVGLDAALAVGLVGTGLLLRRRDRRHVLAAAATSALLVMDAWFDVLTARPGAELLTAGLLAVCVELPLAGVCARIAVRDCRAGVRGGSPQDRLA